MCRSVQGLLLGCLAFSIIYIIAGGVQVMVGIVFMLVLPIFRLASNIWTGAVNIALGGAFSALICCGKSNLTKHKICLSLSIGVVLVNLGNILVLEICEWRAFLPAIRIQDIVREEKTDMLLVAYLSSTISTAVALVVGFVACEYIYCLLIAGHSNTDDDKPASLKRNFPCRTRRASSYEPISFSWVFEASDNFHSVHNSLMRGRGGSNKAFNPIVNLPEKPKPCTKHANNSDYSLPPKRPNVINSISTSGYSSPNWQMQQSHTHSIADRRHRHHYENIEFFHLSHGMHLSQGNVANHRCRLENMARPERDSKSLVQLPMYVAGYDDMRPGVSASSSPVHQSTLPLRGHRKRSLSDSRGRRWDSRSPRKRHKTDFVAELGETSFDDLSFQRRPRLSSTPETVRRFRLPDVTDVTSVYNSPVDKLEETMPSNSENDDTIVLDETCIDVKPTTSNAESTHRPEKIIKSQVIDKQIKEDVEDEVVDENNETGLVIIKEPSFKSKEKEKLRKQIEDSILSKHSLGYQTSISTNGLPAINIEIQQEPNESQSTWKLFRKPSWKDLERSRYKSDDGIVFRSIDRRLKDKILESGGSGGNIHEAGKEGRDCIVHWKPQDGPRLSPSYLDDSDSLVNLSDLELMARQWRTNNMYKKIQQQIAFQQKRKCYNIAPVPASTNHERFAFMEPS